MNTQQDKIWICSFDIGSKNFAFCIEEYSLSSLSKIKNIPYKQRCNVDGTPTKRYETLLNNLYKQGKIIFFKNTDITEGCEEGMYFDPQLYHNMYRYLDEYQEYWGKCSAFIVEEQMWRQKGKLKPNTKACRLEQHCISYFIYYYGSLKVTLSFPAYHKTQVLGAPKIETKTKKGVIRYKAMDKPKRKKWAITKAKEILTLRDDQKTLEIFEQKRKKGIKKMKLDDISDTILHNISFIYLHVVDQNPSFLDT